MSQINAKAKAVVLGTALMNVAEFVSASENVKHAVKIQILTSNGLTCQAALIVSYVAALNLCVFIVF